MKIPESININGHEFKIIITKGDTRYVKAGDMCTWTNTIMINESDGHTESNIAEVLIHEIIETINKHCELNLEHYHITTLASQLFGIIRNNKLDFVNP